MDRSECWNYLGPFLINRSGVYGRHNREGAHRTSYKSFKGNIPKGLTIDHLCRNTICINPDHLEAVTLAENIRRGFSPTAINKRKTACPKGHPYTWRDRGRRTCRPCKIEYLRKHYAMNREKLCREAREKYHRIAEFEEGK